MSTIAGFEEDLDTTILQPNTKFSLQKSFSEIPFVQIITLKAASLLSPEYQLRPIEDKGSLSESLTAANVNLFDRTPVYNLSFIKLLKTVVRVAISCLATTLALPLLAPAGTFYHAYNASKYTYLLIKGDKNKEYNWDKVDKHFRAFFIDLLCSVMLGGFGFGPASNIQEAALYTGAISLLFSAVIAHDPMKATCHLTAKQDTYGLYKSLRLRNEFGLVSKETGDLLTSDQFKDRDIMRSWDGTSGLTGYFGNLYRKESKELLNTIKELQSVLPSDCKMKPFYPPDGIGVSSFLRKNGSSTGLSEAQINEWRSKFYAIEHKRAVLWNIIAEGFKITESTGQFSVSLIKERFLLPKAQSDAYFK